MHFQLISYAGFLQIGSQLFEEKKQIAIAIKMFFKEKWVQEM